MKSRKIISGLLVFTFLLSNIVYADPAAIGQNNPSPQKISQPSTPVTAENIVIQRDAGLVKTRFTGKDDRVIVHIQDAHCNFEAQSNIANIIESLVKNDGLTLVSVEGADGAIDTSWFKAFPDPDIRKEVATYFMKKGEITGPEFLSITTDYPIKLYGAETRAYYLQNLNAFISSYPLKDETEKYYNVIKSAINKLKDYIYSPQLKELDAKMLDYESKKLQFNEYVKYLEGIAETHKINLRQYENLFKLISVLVYEKKIDFNIVDKERNSLIDELSKKLSKDALTELVTKSIQFKTAKISSVEYYEYLKRLASQNGFRLADDHPNLFNYMIYNSVYSRIENEKLFSDIKALESAIKEKLFSNDDQRKLEELSRHIDILIGLVNIKLLNGDFDYYSAHKDEFSYETFASFVNKMAAKYGLAFEIEPPAEEIKNNLPKLDEFYTVAIKRDKALLDNTLASMKKENAKIAVLVTGGFHSEGISRLLEKEGLSYIVVCPNITKEVETPYIKVLTNQTTPLEGILAGASEAQVSAGKAKNGMLAPYVISDAVAMSPDELTAMDRSAGEVKGRGLADRVREVVTAWADTYVSRWISAAEAVAARRNLPQDREMLWQAYLLAVDRAVAAGHISAANRDSVVEYSRQAFEAVYAKRDIQLQPPAQPDRGKGSAGACLNTIYYQFHNSKFTRAELEKSRLFKKSTVQMELNTLIDLGIVTVDDSKRFPRYELTEVIRDLSPPAIHEICAIDEMDLYEIDSSKIADVKQKIDAIIARENGAQSPTEGFNKHRINLEETWQKTRSNAGFTLNDMLHRTSPDVVRQIGISFNEVPAAHNPPKSMTKDAVQGVAEPVTTWQSLIYYLSMGKIRIIVDAGKETGAEGYMSYGYLSEKDGVATKLLTEDEYDVLARNKSDLEKKLKKLLSADNIKSYESTGKMKDLLQEYAQLKKQIEEAEGQMKYEPVSLIHISAATWNDIKNDADKKAELVLRQWVKHFMPSYLDLSPDKHADMVISYYRDSRDGYNRNSRYNPAGYRMNLLDEMEKKGNITEILSCIELYALSSDPSGEVLKYAYQKLDNFVENNKIKDIVNAIEDSGKLLAFYRYLFENYQTKGSALRKAATEFLGRSPDKEISYEERARLISQILRNNKQNKVIDRNISPDNNTRLFNYTINNSGEVVYLPQNIGAYVFDDIFEGEQLPQSGKDELTILSNDWNKLLTERDEMVTNLKAKIDKLKGELKTAKAAGNIEAQFAAEVELSKSTDEIKDKNKELGRKSEKIAHLYNRPLLKRMAHLIQLRRQEQKPNVGRKAPYVFGIYGPTSAGKTTLAEQVKNRLGWEGRALKIDYIGSDSYLQPGDNFRYLKMDGDKRTTFLRNQGIYDLERLRDDLADLKSGHSIRLKSDPHAPGYNPEVPYRDVSPDVDVLIVDYTVLGLNEELVGMTDFLLPVVLLADEVRLGRRMVRDTTAKEFGGDRGLSPDYIINELIEKQFQEVYSNMLPIMNSKAHMAWQQGAGDETSLFERREMFALASAKGQMISKKAPGTEPLTVIENDYIKSQISNDLYPHEDMPVTQEWLNILKDRAPPPGVPSLDTMLMSEELKVVTVDVGASLGFKRYPGASKASELIYAYPQIDENGKGKIYITKALASLLQPYKDLQKEIVKDLSKPTPEGAAAINAGYHSLAQLIAHEYYENAFAKEDPATAHRKAIAEERKLVVSGNQTGISEIDLFILNQAAHTGDIGYLENLLKSWSKDLDPDESFKKALIDALAKAYFINMPRSVVADEKSRNENDSIKKAATNAVEMIDAAIETSLKNAEISKRQDIRAIAFETRPGKTEALCYEVAYRLGLSVAKNYREALGKNDITIVVGKDVRISSPLLQQALMDGLTDAGVRVLDIGRNPEQPYNTTPMISTIVYKPEKIGEKSVDGAIMVTSSHNDFRYGGFKMIIGESNVEEKLLDKIITDAAPLSSKPAVAKGEYVIKDFVTPYKEEVAEFIRAKLNKGDKPLQGKAFAVGGVNGTSGFFADVLETCGATVFRVDCAPNGYFPYGIPDPDKKTTKDRLIKVMSAHPEIEVGVVFDSDGDRLFFAGRSGVNISNHELECLFADNIRGDAVINSRSTMAVQDVKDKHNERTIKCMSGYAFIKAKAKDTGATIGLEESGHFMFGENHYIDDGMKSAALVFLFAQKSGKNIVDLINTYPFRSYAQVFNLAPKLPVPADECFRTAAKFSKTEAVYFGNMNGCSVEMDDGLRVVFDEKVWGFKGWFQFRQALSTPDKFYLDFEATQFNPATGKYEPSPNGIWQMMGLLRDRMSYYDTLKAATDAVTPNAVVNNKDLNETVKPFAKSAADGVRTIQFNSPEVKAAMNYLTANNMKNKADELAYLARTGRITMAAEPNVQVGIINGWLVMPKTDPKPDGLPEQYSSAAVTRAANLIASVGGDAGMFMDQARTRPTTPMVLSLVLPDWDDNTHCGSLLASPLGYRLACDAALEKYGKDLNFLSENSAVSIGGFSDAGTGKRCSPVSQAYGNSRGSMDLVGDVVNPNTGEETGLTLLLATAIQSSKFARANYGKTIDVHYSSQLSVEQGGVIDNYERLKAGYDGYDVMIVSVTDKRQASRQEEAFKRAFNGFLTALPTPPQENPELEALAGRTFDKYVVNAAAKDLTNYNLGDLGMYVIDAATGNVVANYPKGTLEAVDAGNVRTIKVKDRKDPAGAVVAIGETLATYDLTTGARISGYDMSYSYGSHRISRAYLLTIERNYGASMDDRKKLAADYEKARKLDPKTTVQDRPVIEAPDVAQAILLWVANPSLPVPAKSADAIKMAQSASIGKDWMGAHKLSDGDIFWWRYRRPLDILNNQLAMLAELADSRIEINSSAAVTRTPLNPAAADEARAMLAFRGIANMPVTNSTLGNVTIDRNGIRSDTGKPVTMQEVKDGIKIGGVYIKGSVIQDSRLLSGSTVFDSVISKSEGKIQASQSFVDNTLASGLSAERALVMGVIESGPLNVVGTCVVDAFSANISDNNFPQGQTRMWSDFDVDGKSEANVRLPNNKYTFTELYDTIAVPAVGEEKLHEDKVIAWREASAAQAAYNVTDTVIDTAKAGKLTKYTLNDQVNGTSVDIVPGWGATVTAMKARVAGKDVDVLYYGDQDITKASGGIPILWPFANRIRDGKFTWNGAEHIVKGAAGTKDDANGHTYHGMVRNAPWSVTGTGVDKNGAFMICSLDTADYPAMKEHFGAAKFTVTYRLNGNSLDIDLQVRNKDKKDVPMTLALHPWIKAPLGTAGEKAKALVEIPASQRWEATDDHLPTGNLLPVEGRFDMRAPRALGPDQASGDIFDDVFTGLKFAEGVSTSAIHDPVNRVSVTVSQSDGFKHTVLNVPKGKDAVCIEPQTSATDAFNLANNGSEAATPVIVKAGKTFNGKVSIKVDEYKEPVATAEPVQEESAGKDKVKPVALDADQEPVTQSGSVDLLNMTAAQIFEERTKPDIESLRSYLGSKLFSGTLDKSAVIIAYDTAVSGIPSGQVAQEGEKSINRYMNGKLVNVRGTGKKLLEGVEDTARELQAAGIPYKVVTIAGNATVQEVGDALSKAGRLLNVQNPDNRHIPVVGLYELALRIASESDVNSIRDCLNRIASNTANRPFTKADVEEFLVKGVLMILPKIVPVNLAEAAEAYKAAQQALTSL